MKNRFWEHIDWPLIIIYLALAIFGIFNIYSAEHGEGNSIFSSSLNSGQQIKWLIASILIGIGILFVDSRFFLTFAYYFFFGVAILLVITFLTAPEIKGARSWLVLGSFRLGQTSEFAKFATVLALAKFLDGYNIGLQQFQTKMMAFGIILLPVALVILQNDTGTAIVFLALFLALFREGLPGWMLALPVVFAAIFLAVLILGFEVIAIWLGGICLVIAIIVLLMKLPLRFIWVSIAAALLCVGFSFVVNLAFEQLKPHQKTRINVLIGKEEDPQGAGYNVRQSLITIGSGGITGKGFLQGTQTRGAFVPEQTTDFIFCTIGEEFGFAGTSAVIVLFAILLLRIIQLSERQKSRFARVYGYGIAAIIFCHFFLNIAMTLGLFPVIGIPLPFFSYGGSSLLGFTIMLFIFIKLDAGLKYYF